MGWQDAAKQATGNDALTGIVFDIQKYSIHDGPGIRTTVFLKGCPLRCYWCHNPESQRREPEIFVKKSQCTLCGRCVAACPNGASVASAEGEAPRASLEEGATGYPLAGVPVIDRKKCTACGNCCEACPSGARILTGRYVTPDMVMQEVLIDLVFYKNSGGGVTLSGGEATVQSDFALAVLQKCKEAGLHTALDTCGYVAWPVLERLLSYTDLVLYDIKCMGTEKHREATGRSNRMILENAKKIARYKQMRIRVPIIKGFNDSARELRAIARFVKAELGPVDIDLHAPNELGEIKYEWLDRRCVHLRTISQKRMDTLETMVKVSSAE